MFQSGFSTMGPGGYGFPSHLHPSAGYINSISAMHSPHASMSMGYGTNPGVVPPTAAPSPAPSPAASSFMPVPPVPTMPTVIQQSGKQRRSSSTHRYTPIAPAPPSHTSNSTVAPSPSVTTPSTGYYNQHSAPTQPQVPIARPASQYLPPAQSPSHPVPSTATSSTTATAPSCSLAKLQQLTNGLADSASPHHTMTPPPNQTPPPPPPPSHLHGLGHGRDPYGYGVVPTPPPSAISSQQSYAKYYQGSVPSPIPVSSSPVAGLNTTSGVIHSSNNELASTHSSGGHNLNVSGHPGRSSSSSSTAAASSPSSTTGRNSNNSNLQQRQAPDAATQQRQAQIMQQTYSAMNLNGYRMSMAGMAGMPGMPGMPGMGMPSMSSMMAAQHQALNSASYITANPGFMNQSQLGVMNMHAHAAAAHAAQHPHASPHGHSAAAQAAQYQQVDQRTGTPAGMTYSTPYAYGIPQLPQLNGTMRR
ncbi:hypothetical protein DAPPUDRAFT_310484 [Daphnia pulex]|uniref:Uncharacterized protein n=1 Tax=Daphnia pulex TaxID=6669 RepID=E9FTT6_DAPPU|nr:hypothetical protein DAPPUDRAFT_310484 [Daphnia pulex]|eukprot:EFX89587.1 hypothetical protein DAPPUDRAFT_310484 [Daphnia pulex]